MLDFIIAYTLVIGVSIVLFRKWLYSQWLTGISERSVLITGCDSGFGYHLALRLDSIGVKVFACCYSSDNAENHFKAYPRIIGVPMDVTDPDSIKKAHQFVKDKLGKDKSLWGLVNNAGIVMLGPLEFITAEEMKQVLNVNVVGLAEVTKTFLPMIKRSHGRIVNMASFCGRFPVPDMGAYTTSKHAAEGYSDALRVEMKRWKVKVSILEPGFYETGLFTYDLQKQLMKKWLQKKELLDKETKDSYSGPEFEEEALFNREQIKGSKDIHLVIEAYEHALFAVHPKKRYSMLPRFKYILFLTNLPEIISDSYCVRRLFPHPNYDYYNTN